MKRAALTLLAVSILHAAPPLRIVLIGDSTVNDEGGWGSGFRTALTQDNVVVLNHALNGRSSKSFRDEGHWEPALADKPDYVLIQFGHNDQPGKGPERETDAATTYRDNLKRYVAETRAAGAKPILVTSIVRRNFDADGKIKRDALVAYVEATRAVAAELGVPLMDMYERTREQCERLGPALMPNFDAIDKDGKPDHTHLGARGREETGRLAATEFKRVRSSGSE